MNYILNKLDKDIKVTLTNNPITRPFESPNPTAHDRDSLDPTVPQDKMKLEEIERHPNYSPSSEVTLKGGVNKFENPEWAEYFYRMGGDAYTEQYPNGPQNDYWVVECDKEGKEVRGELFNKYRARKGITLSDGGAKPTFDQFQLKDNEQTNKQAGSETQKE